jgi:hypothetical protein
LKTEERIQEPGANVQNSGFMLAGRLQKITEAARAGSLLAQE